MTTYFEDLTLGQVFHSPRSVRMTREDIVSFASAWDPQLYHIDDEAARDTPVGQLFASAVHTLAVSQKLAHEAGAFKVLPVVGLGLSDIRIPLPVLVDDEIRTQATVSEKRASTSRPGLGVVTL